jgi:LPXTG-motif cell wall-anchored protein
VRIKAHNNYNPRRNENMRHKKWKHSIGPAAASVMMLAAVPVSAQELSPEELIKDSRSAMESLDSYSIHTEITYSDSSEIGEFEGYYEAHEDIFTNPFKMRTQASSEYDGAEDSWTTYLTEEAYYFTDFEDTWFKITAGHPEFDMLAYGSTAEGYFDEIEGLDGFSVTEEEDVYVLTYESDGSGYEDILEPSMEEDSGEVTVDLRVNNLFYEVQISKETNYLTNIHREYQTVYEYEDGTREEFNESSHTAFSNFNSAEEFEIPAEVIEGALDFDDYYYDHEEEYSEEEYGDELPATASSSPFYMLTGLLTAAGGMLFMVRRKTVSKA